MATFPTTWDDHISTETTFQIMDNVARDMLDDGSIITRVLGPSRVRIEAVFRNLTDTQSNALLEFLTNNRSGQIDWTIDGKSYQGVLMTPAEITRDAQLHDIRFSYHGIVV